MYSVIQVLALKQVVILYANPIMNRYLKMVGTTKMFIINPVFMNASKKKMCSHHD